jgi:iron complex transport system substrate-binding protein
MLMTRCRNDHLTKFAAWLTGFAVLGCAPSLAVGLALCCAFPRSVIAGPQNLAGPHRIVSLVPATTEILFAIEAGDRLVGVGSYDRFPHEVSRLPRVGGLIDPDTERILALRPDLVVLYGTQVELKQRLDRVGVPSYPYELGTLWDIMKTIRSLGTRIGLSARANSLATTIEQSLAAVRNAVASKPRPKTLLVFGRDPGSLRNVNASGGYGFLADLLDIAGADNALGDIMQPSVQVSTEMILTRRPEAIVELRYGNGARSQDPSRDLAPWNALASVPAVRNRRVFVLVGDEFVVPGPRVVTAAQRLAKTLHPDP